MNNIILTEEQARSLIQKNMDTFENVNVEIKNHLPIKGTFFDQVIKDPSTNRLIVAFWTENDGAVSIYLDHITNIHL